MDQVFEGAPKAEIRLESKNLAGRKFVRSDVTHDWGSRLQWQISRNGKVIATPAARAEHSYEHQDKTPGQYEIVLQMWKYVNYKKNKEGEFTESKYIDISNKIAFKI